MKTILITGGTGLIGRTLTRALLERGQKVIVLTRNPGRYSIPGTKNLEYAAWDINNNHIDESAIKHAEVIIHLAGASVAEKRWTKKRKTEIVSSRVDSGKLIMESLRKIPNKVELVISASATGWYGADKQGSGSSFTEDDPPADDFLGRTSMQWENAIEPVNELKKRLVIFRIGIVMSTEGGAMKEFMRPLKFGVAAIPGNGSQVISWIHIDDLIRAFLYAIDEENMSGVYNAVAPSPFTNKELILSLARKVKGNYFIPVHVPSFLLSLLFGEMGKEVLKSTTVSADKLKESGFIFQYREFSEVVKSL